MTGRSEQTESFVAIEEAIDEIRRGRMVLVVDDEDRENEGDLVMAADRGDARGRELHGQARAGPDLRADDRRAARRAAHRDDGRRQHGPHGHGLHGHGRRQARGDHRHLRLRSRADHPGARRSDHAAGGSGPAGSHPAAPLDAGGRAPTRRPHRGGGGPRPAGRLLPRRRDLRGHGRGRADGAAARAPGARRAARARDDHHQGPDPLPDQKDKLVRRAATTVLPTAHGTFNGDRLRDDGRRPGGASPGDGRARGRRAGPGAHALGVSDRGRVRLAALRLR